MSGRRFFASVMLFALAATAVAGAGTPGGPPNDDAGSAAPITSLPFSVTEDARLATPDFARTCGGSDLFPFDALNQEVWFALSLAGGASVAIDAAGSDYPVALGVWKVTGTTWKEVSCTLGARPAAFTAEAGSTYLIQAMNVAGPAGTLTFNARTPVMPPSPAGARREEHSYAGGIAAVPATQEAFAHCRTGTGGACFFPQAGDRVATVEAKDATGLPVLAFVFAYEVAFGGGSVSYFGICGPRTISVSSSWMIFVGNWAGPEIEYCPYPTSAPTIGLTTFDVSG